MSTIPDIETLVAQEHAAIRAEQWPAQLLRNRDGNPRPVLANCITALRSSPEWSGALAYNEFAARITFQIELPWGEHAGGTWSDQHDRKLAEWLQRHGIMAPNCISWRSRANRRDGKPVSPLPRLLARFGVGRD